MFGLACFQLHNSKTSTQNSKSMRPTSWNIFWFNFQFVFPYLISQNFEFWEWEMRPHLIELFRDYLDMMSLEWYHSIFCFHHPNRVDLMNEHLFGWVFDHCFYHLILWFLSDKLWKVKILKICFQFPKLNFQWYFCN